MNECGSGVSEYTCDVVFLFCFLYKSVFYLCDLCGAHPASNPVGTDSEVAGE
jgi:hypothetical protein